ncbi:MAG: S9 family peptidase [Balneolaceae bacterium]|nr:S9 family peptidase [Balneolaceae bacterium]
MRKTLSLCIALVLCVGVNVSAQEPKPIEFDHLFDGTFTPNTINNVRWMNDGRFYSASDGAKITRFNITNGDSEVIFDGAEFDNIRVQGYEFSADENLILIETDVEQLWRRSTKANYFIYNREENTLQKLTESEEKQQYAALNSEGDRAAFVQNNNLFWVDLATGEQYQITEDGEFNSVINGAADWVYEEEFGFAKAWFWSPNGDRIAFYRFDETDVKQFTMETWGELYPQEVRFKYPKAGEENAIVSIHVFDIPTGEITTMDIGEETDQYIPRINWTRNNNLLAIRRMNRLQNQEELLFADVTSGQTEVILTEESDTWLDVHDDLMFLNNGKQFITTSARTGYNHVYLYKMDGEEIRQITKGEYDVTEIIGFDERRHNLYYMSTEVSPLERHFYRVRVDGRRKRAITEENGWYSINMSRDFKYYIQTYSDYNKPPVITLHEGGGKQVRVLEDNADVRKNLNEFAHQTKEFMVLDVNGQPLNAYMITPPNFDENEEYPVLMYVYGGPGSQTVTRAFEYGQRPMWHQYLANQGYIIVSVDNRGTGGRGEAFKNQTYLQLGVLETEDQIEAARQIADLAFVDDERIGIWGWSYGGFMSTNALAQGNDVLSTAIAVAPVTHWKYYDTIYTERFMRTPQENPEGYEAGSPINYVDQITGDYLLIHGTGDDNVHYQNAVVLVEELIKHDIQFETMFYPNRNHGIYGGNTRRHLWKMMSNFILEKL